MILHIKSAAQAAACLKVRYTGPYAYASAVLVVSTPAAPVLSLGVSDTSLAAAAAALQTVITGDATLTLRDVCAAINNWQDTTSSREVKQGDFQCEMFNALETDVFGGSTSPYPADAGTTYNLKNAWRGILAIDDDATGIGYTSVRLPDPEVSKGPVAIRLISGYPGTSGTPTVTRSIYAGDGTLLWSKGAVATATAALLLTDFEEPVIFSQKPVVVRDTCGTAAHNTATTMAIEYGFPGAHGVCPNG